MPKGKKVIKEEIVEGEIVTPSKEELELPKEDSITVVSGGKVLGGAPAGYQRTFTKKEHGADYKKLAEEWIARFGGKVV